MALFGFEEDEIQIKLTPLLWNLVSGADSGNYLLCKLQPAATDEQRISFLCCRSTIISPSASAPPPPPSFLLAPNENKPLSLHSPDWSVDSWQTGGRLVPSDLSVHNADNNRPASSTEIGAFLLREGSSCIPTQACWWFIFLKKLEQVEQRAFKMKHWQHNFICSGWIKCD